MDQFADQRLEQKFQDLHVSDLRTVRINVSDRLAMTIGIFGSTEFGAADGAILRRLLPYLQSCTRAADIIWRERARASLSANLMQKNIMDWFLIDRAGYIIDATFQYHRDFPCVCVLSGPQGDRLALAERKTELAAGKSLTKAAEQLDLTIETARNYSKKIFAKTATRGQTDLVRLILTHGLAELGHPQVE